MSFGPTICQINYRLFYINLATFFCVHFLLHIKGKFSTNDIFIDLNVQ